MYARGLEICCRESGESGSLRITSAALGQEL
jgi:hypothetical protein